MLDRLLDLLVSCWNFFKFVQVLDPFEQAVVTRCGRVHRIVGPGVHWNWPCALERVHRHPTCTDTQELGVQNLTTSDGVSVTVEGIATYNVENVEELLIKVQGEKQAIIDSAAAEIAFAIVAATFAEVIKEDFWNAVTIRIRRRAKRWGIAIESVRPRHLVRGRTLHLFVDGKNAHLN